nr:hypothetical protein [Nocardioides convexus]
MADETARTVLAEVDPDDEEAAARLLVQKKSAQHARARRAGRRAPAGGHARPQGVRRRAGLCRGPAGARSPGRPRRRLLSGTGGCRTMCA